MTDNWIQRLLIALGLRRSAQEGKTGHKPNAGETQRCRQCNSRVPPSARRCPRCGARIVPPEQVS